MAMVSISLYTNYNSNNSRLFVLEGIPAVIVGMCVWFFLPDCKSSHSLT